MAEIEVGSRRVQGFSAKLQTACRTLGKLRRQRCPSKDASTRYTDLDGSRKEIRLLRVRPGRGCQRVRCRLEHAFLDDAATPKYETISYCWGDPSLKRVINLEGKRTEVPASSKAAIQCMRLPKRDRVLWIDAICINQVSCRSKIQAVLMSHSTEQLYSRIRMSVLIKLVSCTRSMPMDNRI